MKYVIMCGGNYKDQFDIPKPLLTVDGEKLVERTIRLLRENGIKDIAVSINSDTVYFNYLDVELLKRNINYIHDAYGKIKDSKNCWLTAYYPLETPACYLAGDVYWTEQAIKDIINKEVKDTMFICAPDYSDGRKNPSIKGREPLGYIVQNQKIFRKAINDIMKEIDDGKFTYDPVAWNLYRKLNNIPMDYGGYGNDIFKTNGDFMTIDDLTTDIDLQKNIPALEKLIKIERGEIEMIKVRAIKEFYLGAYNELKNIQRKSRDEKNKLFVGDIFECTQDMAEYLTGKNKLNQPFVEIIEVIPEKKKETIKIEKEPIVEEEIKRPTRRRRKTIEKK